MVGVVTAVTSASVGAVVSVVVVVLSVVVDAVLVMLDLDSSFVEHEMTMRRLINEIMIMCKNFFIFSSMPKQ